MLAFRRQLTGGAIYCGALTAADADRLYTAQYNYVRDVRNQSFTTFDAHRARWIDAHHPNDRENARSIADALDNAHISFDEFERTFVGALDAALAFSSSPRRIALVTSLSACKSDNFCARLARQHRPDARFQLLDHEASAPHDADFFIFDDCSYSGIQMVQMIDRQSRAPLIGDTVRLSGPSTSAPANCIVLRRDADVAVLARLLVVNSACLVPLIVESMTRPLFALALVEPDARAVRVRMVRKCSLEECVEAARAASAAELRLSEPHDAMRASHVALRAPSVRSQRWMHVVIPFMMDSALETAVRRFSHPLTDWLLTCVVHTVPGLLRVSSAFERFDFRADPRALMSWKSALLVVVSTGAVHVVRRFHKDPVVGWLMELDRAVASDHGASLEVRLVSTVDASTDSHVLFHMQRRIPKIYTSRGVDLRAYTLAITTEFSARFTERGTTLKGLLQQPGQWSSLVTLGHKLPDYVSSIAAPIVGCGVYISLAHVIKNEDEDNGRLKLQREVSDALELPDEEECLRTLRPIVARCIGSVFAPMTPSRNEFIDTLRRMLLASLFAFRVIALESIDVCSDSYVAPYKLDESRLTLS